jgi:hypothetical protein
MSNSEFFLVVGVIAALWLLRAISVAYLEYRVEIHRINSQHKNISQYWVAINTELQKHSTLNEQLMALNKAQNATVESGQ